MEAFYYVLGVLLNYALESFAAIGFVCFVIALVQFIGAAIRFVKDVGRLVDIHAKYGIVDYENLFRELKRRDCRIDALEGRMEKKH